MRGFFAPMALGVNIRAAQTSFQYHGYFLTFATQLVTKLKLNLKKAPLKITVFIYSIDYWP